MAKTFNLKRIEEDKTILVTDSRGSSVALFDPDGTEPEWFQQLGPQSKNLVEKQVAAFVRGDTPVAVSAGEKLDSRLHGNDSKKEEEGEMKKKTFKPRICKLKSCGVEFTPNGPKQDYCSVDHRIEDKRPVEAAAKKKNTTSRAVIPAPAFAGVNSGLGIQPSRNPPSAVVERPFNVEINPMLNPVEEIEGTIKLAGGFIFAGRVVITVEGIKLDGILKANNG